MPIINSEEKQRRRATIYDSLLHTLIPKDANYSLIYVYMPHTYENNADLILYMDDKKVASLALDDKGVIKIAKSGSVKFRTKKIFFGSEQTLDVEMGKVYFLRCHLYRDGNVVRPSLGLVIPSKGIYDIGFKKLHDMASELEQKR